MDIRSTILEVMAKRNISPYRIIKDTNMNMKTVYGFLVHGKSIQHTGLERILTYLGLEVKER